VNDAQDEDAVFRRWLIKHGIFENVDASRVSPEFGLGIQAGMLGRPVHRFKETGDNEISDLR
jgi:hypothetical protein